jgi:sugar lactone lactonase YvrE
MFSSRFKFCMGCSTVASAIALLSACGGGGDPSFWPIMPGAQQPPVVLSYTIGGAVNGLEGSLVLQNNAGDDLTLKADGTFSFAISVAKDGAYDVKVRTQPLWQFCTVAKGSGTVTANVADIAVTCSAAAAQVTTLAGSGTSVSVDGNGAAASFATPIGIVIDKSGVLTVSDSNSGRVRKVAPNGDVTTFAGSGAGTSLDGNGVGASFSFPDGMSIGPSDVLYVAEYGGNLIRKITATADVTTFAGSGVAGSADGNGTVAQFRGPSSVAVDGAGNTYVAEVDGCVVRQITPGGAVTTLAGTSGTCSFADGVGAAASFRSPGSIAVDATGNLFVADGGNHRIRKITPAGVVSTFAGSAASGATDGTGSAASFNFPTGLAFDADGNLYVVDGDDHLLRRITPAGVVSTLAGQVGVAGAQDGIGAAATFNQPTGVAVGADGTIYVADTIGNLIRKVTPVQAP